MNAQKMKILLVEDDQDLREIILAQLAGPEYTLDSADHGQKAKELIEKNHYDLFLFDWMIPGPSGIDLCRMVHHKFIDSPDSNRPRVVMITAKASPQFIVEGLDSGADDYITKPFTMEVLLARLRVHLRRRLPIIADQRTPSPAQVQIKTSGPTSGQSGDEESTLVYGPLKINESKYEILCEGHPLQLTVSEFKILKALVERPGHVFTRKQLIERMAGSGIHVGGRTIDTQLVGLRKKMGHQGALIETIRGIGYRFKEC